MGDNEATTSEPTSKRLRQAKNDAESSELIHSQRKDSLMYLNDHCLQKLFENLDIDGLCQMANVCKRFRQVAQQVFDEHHKEFELENTFKQSTFRRVLSQFGSQITGIDALEVYGADRIDPEAIAKYCGPKLESLYLNGAKINCDVMTPLFGRLKNLVLEMCEMVGNAKSLFANCTQLETLHFNTVDSCGFIVRAYPKLNRLTFDCGFMLLYPTFLDLLELNPQLKHLHLMAQPEDLFIENIVQLGRNLESLKIRQGLMASTPEITTRRGFLKLSKLKKLKQLALDACDEMYAKLLGPLMDAFVKAGVALEHLDVRDFEITSKVIKSIQQMTSMKQLFLNQIGKGATEADLLGLTTKLPLLSNLQFYFRSDKRTPLTASGLAKMVQAGKHLEYLALVGVQNMKIDRKIFEHLLKIVNDRDAEKKLIIDISGCPSTCGLNVPQDLLQANYKHLEMRYEGQDDCECESCEHE